MSRPIGIHVNMRGCKKALGRRGMIAALNDLANEVAARFGKRKRKRRRPTR